MFVPDHGCCLVAVPHPVQAADGDNWTCDVCGTRWVLTVTNGKGSWYRSKLAGART